MKRFSHTILVLPLIFYLFIATREFYWDGVAFAIDIENATGNLSSLVRPNHLIYNLVGYFLFEAFGEQFRALYLLQALNAVLAGICILIVFLILREKTHSHYHSVCIALIMAFSATWWRFAIDANAYIPSILFLLICYRLLLPTGKPRPLFVGLAHATAMLFHQLAIFFLPVAVAALWKQTRKWSSIVCYVSVSFTITIAAFIGAYCSVSYHDSFWNWITIHSADSHFTYSLFHNVGLSLLGNFKLFFDGRIILLQFDAVTVLGIIGLAIGIGWLIKLRGEIKKGFQEIWGQITRLSLFNNGPLCIWILCFLLFLLFWLPQNTFYRLFYLPAVIFLVGALGHPWKQKFRRSLILAVSVLFLWNFTFLIYPYSRVESNEILSFALQHRKDWPQGTTIIFSEFHSNLWTISYFNPQVSWLWKTDFMEVIGYPTNGPLWLEGTTYDKIRAHPEGDKWLSAHIDLSRSFIYRSPLHVFRFYQVFPTSMHK